MESAWLYQELKCFILKIYEHDNEKSDNGTVLSRYVFNSITITLYKEYLGIETSSGVRDTWCFWLSIYCQYFNVDVMNLICNLLIDFGSFIGKIHTSRLVLSSKNSIY